MNNLQKIRSFVRRSGRLTSGQKMGLGEFWKDYGINLPDGKIDLNSLFVKPQKIILEVGFGNGDSLLEMAINEPEYNFLGIEVYEAGVGRLINKANKYHLKNLKIIKEDAIQVLENNIADDSLASFQLYFPDPWHKTKHHKRRIVQTSFLDLLSQKIIPNGSIHIATDWASYGTHIMNVLESHPHFKNTQNSYIYSPRPKRRPVTKFEKQGERLGHKILDLIFTNERRGDV